MIRYGEPGYDYESHDLRVWWDYHEDKPLIFAHFWAQVEIVVLMQCVWEVHTKH